MKLRKELLGIVLAFSMTGIIATSANANAYQEIYDQQEKQEQKIKTLLESEFISADEQSILKNELSTFAQARNSQNRQGLLALIAQSEEQVSQVSQSVASMEANTIQTELGQVEIQIDTLVEKSDEAFISKADQDQIKDLVEKYQTVSDTKEITPVRALADEAKTLTEAVTDNQKELISLVDTLKADNESSDTLLKKPYLSDSEKKELNQNKADNQQFFEDADVKQAVVDRQEASSKLIETISQKQAATAKDFKSYEDKAKSLVNEIKSLLSNGDLSDEEKTELTSAKTQLEDSLVLKDYTPGNLKTGFTDLDDQYTNAKTSSDKRIADKKKAAEAAAEAEREKQEKEQAAQAKAAEEANQASSNQTGSNQSTPSPSLVGEWYQAPDGYKFLKVESGKTYGQVKIPSNFTLITATEAQSYTPGRGNGYAKQ